MFYRTDASDSDMIFESKRLATFRNWSIASGPLAAVNMAKAGFYRTSDDPGSDCVRCFCCFKDLENWDEDDDPWVEHKKRNKCLFAKLETEERKLTSSQKTQILEERFKNLQEKRRLGFESAKSCADELINDE